MQAAATRCGTSLCDGQQLQSCSGEIAPCRAVFKVAGKPFPLFGKDRNPLKSLKTDRDPLKQPLTKRIGNP